MAGTIGIKEANGNFYPIFEEDKEVKKRLILTTVHDNQKSVQIDLYRSQAKSMADAMYIGSLVVENVSPKSKGDPSIEMTLSSSDGAITADAVDLGNPDNKHHLSVSLKSFEEDKNEYPDFEVEEDTSTGYKKIQVENEKKRFPWLALVIAGIILALVCLCLWFFLFRNKSAVSEQGAAPFAVQDTIEIPAVDSDESTDGAGPAVPPLTARAPPVEASKISPAGSAVQQNNSRPPARGKPPVYSFKVPQTIPPEGITYKIRWGDTLWDISEVFYHNPRMFSAIVKDNEIGNPNLIVSGTELTIPPKK